MQIQTYSNPETLAKAAAVFICDRAQAGIARSGRFSLVLSGGSTPERTYRKLVDESVRKKLDWNSVEVFWGDERCVPPDHPESNYGLARRALFDFIPIPDDNLHRMACEGNPQAGARDYEALLRASFPDQRWPHFDMVLLGLGEDGHTASLFPGTEILGEQERWVAPVFVPRLSSWRITLTLPVINAARRVVFLVAGGEKAPIVQQLLEPTDLRPAPPASLIKPNGELIWVLDQQAASRLTAT